VKASPRQAGRHVHRDGAGEVSVPPAHAGACSRVGRRGANRGLLLALALAAGLAMAGPRARADERAQGWDALAAGGHVVALRHAATSGGAGDPPGFRVEDCATQRGLTGRGREQARRLGAAFARGQVRVDRLLSSAWCRCRDTARLMGLGPVEILPALNNLHGHRSAEPERTAAVRALVEGWRGPGTLVLVSHGANIRPLTGIHPQEGEGVVLRPRPGTSRGFEVAGRVAADP
jgi:phosphohistidine phosphatase SixA